MTANAVRSAFSASLASCREHESELGQLDSVAGDGDHGSGMVRGFTAACSAITGLEEADSALITAAGTAFADAAGGWQIVFWPECARSRR